MWSDFFSHLISGLYIKMYMMFRIARPQPTPMLRAHCPPSPSADLLVPQKAGSTRLLIRDGRAHTGSAHAALIFEMQTVRRQKPIHVQSPTKHSNCDVYRSDQKTKDLYTSKVPQNAALAMCTGRTRHNQRRPVHIQNPTKHGTTNVYRSEKKRVHLYT